MSPPPLRIHSAAPGFHQPKTNENAQVQTRRVTLIWLFVGITIASIASIVLNHFHVADVPPWWKDTDSIRSTKIQIPQ